MSTTCEVQLWGRTIAAVTIPDDHPYAYFEYTPEFARDAQNAGIEVAPLTMPVRPGVVYTFADLDQAAFHGLPGMLADSLPDAFGNDVIDAWLAQHGRAPGSFNAVERLCYTGTRGLGALEFVPALGPDRTSSRSVDVDHLVSLAADVLGSREQLRASLKDPDSLTDIVLVGTSAGGARAKAVIAWNPETHEVRTGQATAPDGFQQWLIKFDGVSGNGERGLSDPQGYGALEHAYSQMAVDAGVTMTETRLLEESGRRHFMTRRFDRTDDGRKLHMTSLGGLCHFNYKQPRSYSYEQAFLTCKQLRLSAAEIEQLYRRMVFNVVARNQDDHVKNIAFLMDQSGQWTLSPAFDITWSYNPQGDWTSQHQMSINGKRDNFTFEDLRATAEIAGLKRGRARTILDDVTRVVEEWDRYASDAHVSERLHQSVTRTIRRIATS